MPKTPPLPLSQQVLDWLVNATGFAEDHFTTAQVSYGTFKRARKGEVLKPATWALLLPSLARLLSWELDAGGIAKMEDAFRSWDESVSRLPNLDIEPVDRVLPLVRRALPEVGVRLGAFIAGAVLRWGGTIDDWEFLCDPLSRKFFGQVALRLIRHRRPQWQTLDQIYEGLEGSQDHRHIIDRTTLQRWHSGARGHLPRPEHVEALGNLLGGDSVVLLRLARAVTLLQRDLKGWIGKERTEEAADILAGFARLTAAALLEPWNIADLADAHAASLEQGVAGSALDLHHSNARYPQPSVCLPRMNGSWCRLASVRPRTSQHNQRPGIDALPASGREVLTQKCARRSMTTAFECLIWPREIPGTPPCFQHAPRVAPGT